MERMRRGPHGKTAARRVEILDAALALSGRSGYRSGSIREIAGAVGMSQAGLLQGMASCAIARRSRDSLRHDVPEPVDGEARYARGRPCHWIQSWSSRTPKAGFRW
jgi:hypothetical protein